MVDATQNTASITRLQLIGESVATYQINWIPTLSRTCAHSMYRLSSSPE